MHCRYFFVIALLVTGLTRLAASDEPAPKSRMKEVLRARAEEEAKKKPAAPAPVPAPAKANAEPVAATTPAPEKAAAEVSKKDAPKNESAAQSGPETPTVLPQVEVRKDRITELDIRLHEQKKEIRREQKNTKPTEMDEALNHPAVSKVLAIFGGESSKHRAGIAQERVELMEAESDLMEAIAEAKTKEEKAELEKQLDQLKVYRRELEKALR